jgi:hypothetical protein
VFINLPHVPLILRVFRVRPCLGVIIGRYAKLTQQIVLNRNPSRQYRHNRPLKKVIFLKYISWDGKNKIIFRPSAKKYLRSSQTNILYLNKEKYIKLKDDVMAIKL